MPRTYKVLSLGLVSWPTSPPRCPRCISNPVPPAVHLSGAERGELEGWKSARSEHIGLGIRQGRKTYRNCLAHGFSGV